MADYPTTNIEGTFYRVENGDGRGPYQAAGCYGWKEHTHDQYHGKPCPHQDKIVLPVGEGNFYKNRGGYLPYEELSTDYIYGFDTLDKLQKWFSKVELLILKEKGFKVVLVKGMSAFILEKQVAFKRLPRENNADLTQGT